MHSFLGMRSEVAISVGAGSLYTPEVTAWYGNCSASDRKALQRVVRMAQCITAIQDLYTRRCQRKAVKIV